MENNQKELRRAASWKASHGTSSKRPSGTLGIGLDSIILILLVRCGEHIFDEVPNVSIWLHLAKPEASIWR